MTARAAVAASSHNGPPPPGHYEGSASRPISLIQPSGASSGAMLHRPQDSVSSRIAYASPRTSSSAPHHPLGAPSHPPPYPSHAGHPTTQPPLSARTPATSHAGGQPMLSARTPPVGLGEASPRPGSAKVLVPPKPASQPASAIGPTSATLHGGSAAAPVGGAVAAAGLPAECTGCFSPLLTPAAVLKSHAHHLTAYEQAEVLDHPQVRPYSARTLAAPSCWCRVRSAADGAAAQSALRLRCTASGTRRTRRGPRRRPRTTTASTMSAVR